MCVGIRPASLGKTYFENAFYGVFFKLSPADGSVVFGPSQEHGRCRHMVKFLLFSFYGLILICFHRSVYGPLKFLFLSLRTDNVYVAQFID